MLSCLDEGFLQRGESSVRKIRFFCRDKAGPLTPGDGSALSANPLPHGAQTYNSIYKASHLLGGSEILMLCKRVDYPKLF